MPHRPRGKKGTKWAPICDGCGGYHLRVDCPNELHDTRNVRTPSRGGGSGGWGTFFRGGNEVAPRAAYLAGPSYLQQTKQKAVSTAPQVPPPGEPATINRTPTPPASTGYANQQASPKYGTGSAHSGLTPTSEAAAAPVNSREVTSTRASSPQSSASVPGGYAKQPVPPVSRSLHESLVPSITLSPASVAPVAVPSAYAPPAGVAPATVFLDYKPQQGLDRTARKQQLLACRFTVVNRMWKCPRCPIESSDARRAHIHAITHTEEAKNFKPEAYGFKSVKVTGKRSNQLECSTCEAKASAKAIAIDHFYRHQT